MKVEKIIVAFFCLFAACFVILPCAVAEVTIVDAAITHGITRHEDPEKNRQPVDRIVAAFTKPGKSAA